MMRIFGLKPTFLNFVLTTFIFGVIIVILNGITGCTFISAGDKSVIYYDKDITVTDNKSDVSIPLIP